MTILTTDAFELDAATQAPTTPRPTTPSPTSALAALEDRFWKLEELAELTEAGVLTAEESAAVKERILAS